MRAGKSSFQAERRESPRMDGLWRIEAEGNKPSQKQEGLCINLSRQGAELCLDPNPPVGALINIVIEMEDQRRLSVPALIVRQGGLSVGVRFSVPLEGY